MKSVSRKKDRPVRSERDSLGRVLDQNEKIKDNVEEAADSLASVNDVLLERKEAGVPVQSLKEAIAQNEEAESQVAKAAGDLAQVNTELANQITERTVVESELVDMTINLLEAREDLTSSHAQASAERTVFESELADMKIDLAEAREDLSKSRAKEEETRQIAFQDALTGLPNRVLFEQALDHGLIQAKRYGRGLAVLFIDIDKFKNVNDLHGHDLGDRVLLMVAERLRSSVRAEDTVSRWGGDEFVCLLLEVKQESDVTRLAEAMVDRIADDWEFNGTVLSIRASIGIALYPADGETAEALFKKADQAMYRAKGTEKRVMLAGGSV